MRRPGWAIVAGVVLVAGIGLVVSVLLSEPAAEPVGDAAGSDSTAGFGPRAAVQAAARFQDDPSAASLRDLFHSLGGFAGLTIATATGSFEVVTFDPGDPDRLLASNRASYGPARNDQVNQLWTVVDDHVEQGLWDAGTPHDFAHFNPDGTITMWSLSGSGDGPYPYRIASLHTGPRQPIGAPTAAMYPARFDADDGTVFALVTNGRSLDYLDLVADDGSSQTVLDGGTGYSWVDVPSPGLVVAYPAGDGVTAVWDTATLTPLDDHPLAGLRWQRLAVSADGRTAVGIDRAGSLVVLDMASGDEIGRFGSVDPAGVARPLALSPDGTVAVTVDRDGTVAIWWVGGELIAARAADSGLPRWVHPTLATRLGSVVAPDAGRVALRNPARPGEPVSWDLLDTDVASWIVTACERSAPEQSSYCG